VALIEPLYLLFLLYQHLQNQVIVSLVRITCSSQEPIVAIKTNALELRICITHVFGLLNK